MKPILPKLEDLPDNVQPVKFTAPQELAGDVEDIVGCAHKTEDGQTIAIEFLFELNDDEVRVLKHEPYLTFTIMADHLHVFAIQTSFPPDKKYSDLEEHTHKCPDCEKFSRCENPRHEMPRDRVRQCDKCWLRTQKELQAS